MDIVTVSRNFTGELSDVVAYCRTLRSRTNWPGATLEYEQPDVLHYSVGMRLRTATMTDLHVVETLGEVEDDEDGALRFDSMSANTWPDGRSGSAAEFLFRPGRDGAPHTLRLTCSYTAPGKSLVKSRDLPAFHHSMEKVIGRYADGLIAGSGATALPSGAVAAPAHSADLATDIPGMDTVMVARTFRGDVADFVAFTRTLDSRRCWPGSVLEYEQPEALHYGVGMRLHAAAMTDIHVEDRLGDVEHLEGGEVRYATSQRVLWPDGHADAITEYLFIPGRDGAENVIRFTYSYPPPSTKLVKTKALPEFHVAMEKVSSRYLKKLVEHAAV